MVDEAVKAIPAHVVDAHAQGGYGVLGHEAPRERPADDLVGEGVGEQVQVEHALIGVYVSDVGHPQAVHRRRPETLYHVPVFPVVMIGARRVTPALGLEHQPVLVHEAVEAVTAGGGFGKDLLYHEVELVGAYAGSLTADGLHGMDYLTLANRTLFTHMAADGVITFAALAKQSAQASQGYAGMPGPKVVYCLAPAFLAGRCRIARGRSSTPH